MSTASSNRNGRHVSISHTLVYLMSHVAQIVRSPVSSLRTSCHAVRFAHHLRAFCTRIVSRGSRSLVSRNFVSCASFSSCAHFTRFVALASICAGASYFAHLILLASSHLVLYSLYRSPLFAPPASLTHPVFCTSVFVLCFALLWLHPRVYSSILMLLPTI
jgi:hypothetical protein